ncbi:MAG: carbohydrate binding domain-containing protein [Anaerolineales bacterium]
MRYRLIAVLAAICFLALSGGGQLPLTVQAAPPQQSPGSDPPDSVVKLIFIHHSTGENWLADGYGNLGLQLAENNYFVSDTNYGWGPDGIGDRTDIPDWTEWFRGENTPEITRALYNESGQHSSYTRGLSDPGGENQIIMFKSCFPNSDLEGSPTDPPDPDGWLSVGHAKFVYNQILGYFGQHPDKLFVVITAPPLSDPGIPENARAFNLWLVNDWLEENDYPFHNVAVFDFYNVLTGKDGHHTFTDGQESYQNSGRNTLFYPSDDDHPSRKGSQKATEEFIPLLNYFYNRWQADNPAALQPLSDAGADQAAPVRQQQSAPELTGILDDFEGAAPGGTNGWEAYWDVSTPTSLECSQEEGTGMAGNSLRLDYQVAPYSWGTCGLSYDDPQDWSGADGLSLLVQTANSGNILHIDLYAEGPGGRESYVYYLPLSDEMEGEWAEAAVPWSSFTRVEWEENPGEPFQEADRVSGLAIGFGTEEDQIQGTVWIDDLGWLGMDIAPVQVAGDEGLPSNEAAGEREPVNWVWFAVAGLVLVSGGAGILAYRKKAASRR